eukprot:scaffold119957_cov35-Tisochrysis_lutea.AAC.2
MLPPRLITRHASRVNLTRWAQKEQSFSDTVSKRYGCSSSRALLAVSDLSSVKCAGSGSEQSAHPTSSSSFLGSGSATHWPKCEMKGLPS